METNAAISDSDTHPHSVTSAVSVLGEDGRLRLVQPPLASVHVCVCWEEM